MYRRQIELIGKENQEKLSKKTILIVGCGGLGNIIATTLSCIGLKKIYLIDYDKIELHNIHRQFQFSESDVGNSKSIMLSEKIKRCNNTQIIGLNKKFDDELDLNVDIVFDATDNFDTRIKIDKFAKKNKISWIYASVEEFIGQVGLFKKTSFDVFATKETIPKGQIPPMVNLVGSIASMIGIKALIEDIEEILYFIDFNEDLEVKKFKLGG